jgi:hypothetical protein
MAFHVLVASGTFGTFSRLITGTRSAHLTVPYAIHASFYTPSDLASDCDLVPVNIRHHHLRRSRASAVRATSVRLIPPTMSISIELT